MATSQYGSLTPLQHFNQHQHQHHHHQQHPHQHPHPGPHPHYNQLTFQHIHQTASPQLQPTAHAPNGTIHPHLPSQPASAGDGPSLHPAQIQSMSLVPPTPNHQASNLNLNVDPSLSAAETTPIHATDERRKAGRPAKRRRQDKDVAEQTQQQQQQQQQTQRPADPTAATRQSAAHPFSKGPYNTLEDAIFSLQLHVFTSGYGVSQKRTVKEKLPSGKYDPEGDIIRKDFACDKGGNEFVSQSRGERRRESKKCGCPWKAAIRRLRREGDRWFIEILENQHNHPVTEADEMHTLASYRRWQRENNAGIRSAISRLTRAAAMPARQIASYLKGDLRDAELDRIDKQILRALSMNDKELPGGEKDTGSVVFEMLARRPVIILQENNEAAASTPGVNGQQPSTSNPVAPAAKPPGTTMAPGNALDGQYTFTTAYANPPTTHSTPNPTSMAISTGDTASGVIVNSTHTEFSVSV